MLKDGHYTYAEPLAMSQMDTVVYYRWVTSSPMGYGEIAQKSGLAGSRRSIGKCLDRLHAYCIRNLAVNFSATGRCQFCKAPSSSSRLQHKIQPSRRTDAGAYNSILARRLPTIFANIYALCPSLSRLASSAARSSSCVPASPASPIAAPRAASLKAISPSRQAPKMPSNAKTRPKPTPSAAASSATCSTAKTVDPRIAASTPARRSINKARKLQRPQILSRAKFLAIV